MFKIKLPLRFLLASLYENQKPVEMLDLWMYPYALCNFVQLSMGIFFEKLGRAC